MFGSCFRTLAVILVSDFLFYFLKQIQLGTHTHTQFLNPARLLIQCKRSNYQEHTPSPTVPEHSGRQVDCLNQLQQARFLLRDWGNIERLAHC